MAAEFPYQWKKKCAITIDHTKVGADLSNFQVTMIWTGSTATSNLPQSMFDTTGTSAKSDGSDVRFTSDLLGEKQLPFEIVTFGTSATPASVKAEIYVKLTSVSSVVNTVFYVWWGNSSATAYTVTSPYGRNAVWSDSVWVLHLNESAGTTATDSTGNNHNGTYVGNIPNLTTGGPINNFQRFERTNSGISLGSSNGLPSGNTFNFMFLMANNWTGADSWNYIYTKEWTSNARFQRAGGGNTLYIQPEPNGESYGGTNVNDGAFRTTHYHFDQTDGARVRLNGTVDVTNTGTAALSVNSGIPQTIGYNDLFTGGIDSDFAEIRYRETTRTVGWMTSEVNTLNSPSTFAYLSSETTIAPMINVVWIPNPIK
jgi:hypothetical protein